MGQVLKTKRKELSPAHRAKIWTLHEEGYNPSEIHAKTGTPRSTINGVIARQILNPDPSFKSRPRSGQPKKISQRGTRALVRYAISEPRTTLKALSTPSKSGKQLHFHTVVTVLKSFRKQSVDHERSPSWLSYTKRSVGSIAGLKRPWEGTIGRCAGVMRWHLK